MYPVSEALPIHPSIMSTPSKIQVPRNADSMHITALSLYEERCYVEVSWTDGNAGFGTKFIGPRSSFVLVDKVFGQSIVSLHDNLPKEITVSFKFHETTATVGTPISANVGPQGSGTQIQLTSFATSDERQEKPTTITILFGGALHGLKK